MHAFSVIVFFFAAGASAAAALEHTLPYAAPLGYKVVDTNSLVPIKSHNASASSFLIILNTALFCSSPSL
jgi:hypothetical protein